MTPAVVAARRAKIEFALHEYQHDAGAASYGLEAAAKLGLDPAQVFKTLLAKVDGQLVVGVVPVACSLDLKALAAALGGKRAVMAEVAEAERATGYVAGGISPLGQKRRLPTVIDHSALAYPRIHVSAGRRGLEIELAPQDLQRLCNARTAAIGKSRHS
jgi:Cys-tRNA(Pro)/Cys-tRNA(Cys) deacylase